MAKWKLTADHFLNVICDNFGEKINYEYSETDTQTNRVRRRSWDVPMFIPKESIVTNSEDVFNAFSGDVRERPIVFKGDPTPEMMPLDDEAREISAKFEPKWRHAIESLPANHGETFSASLIAGFEKLLTEASKNSAPLPNVSAKSVDPDAFAKMQEQLATLAEQNAALNAALEGKLAELPVDFIPTPTESKPSSRRV